MASFNRVILVGNLTRDPEFRNLPSGMAVADLGIAVNDRRKDSVTGNMIEEVTYVDITLWGRQAEVAAEYTRKGNPVLIEGRLKLDTWEADGQKRSKLKVVGERLQLLSSRTGSDGYQQGGGYQQEVPPQGGYQQGGYRQGGYQQGAGANSSRPATGGQPSYDAGPARYDTPSEPPPGDDIPF